MQVKHCAKCREDKPLQEFAKNRSTPDGLQVWCRTCRAACQREHYSRNTAKVLARNERYRQANPERVRSQERWYHNEHPELSRRASQRNYQANRAAVFGRYGHACACCGSAERLTIDHIDGGGQKHRAEIGDSSTALYRWLVKNGFPEGYQTLCRPCNRSKGEGESCRINHVNRPIGASK